MLIRLALFGSDYGKIYPLIWARIKESVGIKNPDCGFFIKNIILFAGNTSMDSSKFV